jgi:hypothetical protein
MLMLAASRRKGDYAPRFSLTFLGNPVVLAAIYTLYLGGVFVYGLIIWQDPIQRAIAIGVGVLMVIVWSDHPAGFRHRMVVERSSTLGHGRTNHLAVIADERRDGHSAGLCGRGTVLAGGRSRDRLLQEAEKAVGTGPCRPLARTETLDSFHLPGGLQQIIARHPAHEIE